MTKLNSQTSPGTKQIALLSMLFLVSVLVACSAPNGQTPDDSDHTNNATNNNDTPGYVEPEGELLQSTLSRELSPSVPASDADELAAANREFALNLYQQVREDNPNENLFLSPHSISIALAMLYAGANGETESQMADALNYTLPQDRLHAAFNALDLELAKRGEGEFGEDDGEPFELAIVNATWGQKDYPFLESYLDILALNYGAGMRVVDFASEPNAARERINEWVEERTQERIKDLLPEDSIDSDTRLVLTNAIYFKAGWLEPFNEHQTTPGDFTRLDGSTVEVPMMRQTGPFAYAEPDGAQVIELPYVGDQVSMVVILPEEDTFSAFESALDAAKLDEMLSALSESEGTLHFPKFEFESEFGLNEVLQAMGMVDAFEDGVADLSGIDGRRKLYVTDVVHKSFVLVDEEGTEAAAATGVVVGIESAPMEVFDMRVDRPFLFVIRDKPTGALLFLGSVLDPSAS